MGAGLLLFHCDIITLATEIGIFVIQEKWLIELDIELGDILNILTWFF